jgi:hypothetical protein
MTAQRQFLHCVLAAAWAQLHRDARDRPARPTGDPNPFEAWLFAACAVQGVALLVGWADPTSIQQALPPLFRTVWAVMLALGGTAVIVGLYWPWDPFTGVEIKRPGLVACAAATLAYSIALLPYGAAGLMVSVFNASFAVACIVRVRQIARRMHQAREQLAAVNERARQDDPGGP